MILKSINNEKKVFLILILIFIVTEIIDDLLDHILGISKIHSIIQLVLFLVLFLIIARISLGYYRKKIRKLIPPELRNILEIIKKSEADRIMINLIGLMKLLKITKPTLKKRIDQLVYLNYIYFEKQGNNKYIRLTNIGNSILK
ncbi:MAG: hypothetical protein KAQ83_01340 [Nanoarchaeota archaeon]|nr:hypothetical protein [Nanoarchaeota archaeon]